MYSVNFGDISLTKYSFVTSGYNTGIWSYFAEGMFFLQNMYSMTSQTRGRALIIDNYHFQTLSDRPGSQHDAKMLRSLFEKLKFVVQVEENLSSEVSPHQSI